MKDWNLMTPWAGVCVWARKGTSPLILNLSLPSLCLYFFSSAQINCLLSTCPKTTAVQLSGLFASLPRPLSPFSVLPFPLPFFFLSFCDTMSLHLSITIVCHACCTEPFILSKLCINKKKFLVFKPTFLSYSLFHPSASVFIFFSLHGENGHGNNM